jgi:polygalacturonase
VAPDSSLAVVWEFQRWRSILPVSTLFVHYQSSYFVLRGQGLVDGKGQWWWDTFQFHFSKLSAGRPNLVRLVNYTNVEITGVTLKDSPFWCLHPVSIVPMSTYITSIYNPLSMLPNSDGIDPDSCPHVMVEYNDVSSGDCGRRPTSV